LDLFLIFWVGIFNSKFGHLLTASRREESLRSMGGTRQYVARWRRTINMKTLRKEENKNQSVMRNFKPQEQEQFVC
jgi:hypothetical protein